MWALEQVWNRDFATKHILIWLVNRNLGNVCGLLRRGDILTERFSDFADEHPQAEVIGTDISPIQPSWVPPNVKL